MAEKVEKPADPDEIEEHDHLLPDPDWEAVQARAAEIEAAEDEGLDGK